MVLSGVSDLLVVAEVEAEAGVESTEVAVEAVPEAEVLRGVTIVEVGLGAALDWNLRLDNQLLSLSTDIEDAAVKIEVEAREVRRLLHVRQPL